MSMMEGTTIVAVRRDGKCAMAGDGQVTFGEKTIMKHGAVKVRRLYKGQVVVGFAGSVADAFTLSERFEAKLEQYGGSLSRAAVELAQEWRSDKMMRKLEAMLIAADKDEMLVVSGTGEVIDPDGASWPSVRAAPMPRPRPRRFWKTRISRRERLRKRPSRLPRISAYSLMETSRWRRFDAWQRN